MDTHSSPPSQGDGKGKKKLRRATL